MFFRRIIDGIKAGHHTRGKVRGGVCDRALSKHAVLE